MKIIDFKKQQQSQVLHWMVFQILFVAGFDARNHANNHFKMQQEH